MQDPKSWSLQIGGRELVVETGRMAGHTNGSATVRYGDTQVLATAVMSHGASHISGYFPLMVDYEERYYAAGKIKGSRFIKREGRPSDEAILTGRLVDRTIRPLFNMRMRNDVQVVVTVLSFDGENDPDVPSIIAASAALTLSDIPWNGPVSAVRVGQIDGEFVLNPTNEDRKTSKLDLIVSGTQDKINMLEAGAQEVPEDDMVRAFAFGHEAISKITTFLSEIRSEVGKEKAEPALLAGPEGFDDSVRAFLISNGLSDALYAPTKAQIKEQMNALRAKSLEYIAQQYPDTDSGHLRNVFELVLDEESDKVLHARVLGAGERPDGRGLDEVRKITCETGVLPRTHGTGLFTRGETQALTVTTLGSPGDQQIIDTMEVDEKKRYIHHYNFPPYSVGEVRPLRGPGRREIGHGALAERALIPVLPSQETFPYTILLVSEILSSNGSSSMASTCGSTLSLMDAGVPITRPVSGIAMGIIVGETDSDFRVLSDIQGIEDHYGDMDFKAAGTEVGVTAVQMDVKVDGVTVEMLKAVLSQARESRVHILEKMLAELSAPRTEMSPYAPRIVILKINPDKIRDVIGPGGKVINEIIDQTGVSIDIEDDGSVFITSTDSISSQKAVEWVKNITREVVVGEIFQGRVTRIMNFGAFVEVLPGQEGLVHISKLSQDRVEKVEDVVSVGDMIPVKVVEIDTQGRINLSLKDAVGGIPTQK
ncbi:MAG: polyribonucleotide nucleotidyltransferase [Candidatus Moranbacteria bacterium]|nr:polyribonucleotide nucleotidyltransferase [Candidatus Moranbacteria bacterium]